eukprot:TRINITY_DN470_c0_g1_i1.p1 TRINITY_DN470_c0_g1~~TRINITY_DN470_c0_g1_i1.p1  ORF type:complete len:319 (-),score=49.14 TRINITY_DN470_c0_g1_i1:76-1032(-)
MNLNNMIMTYKGAFLSTKTKMKELTKQFQNLFTEREDLKRELMKLQEISSAAYQKLLSEEADKEKLAKKLDDANKSISILKKYEMLNPDKASLQLEINALKAKNNGLKDELYQLRGESLELAKKSTSLSEKNTSLSEKNNALSDANGQLFRCLGMTTSIMVRNAIDRITQIYKNQHKKILQQEGKVYKFTDYKGQEVVHDEAKGAIVLKHMKNCKLLNSEFVKSSPKLMKTYRTISAALHQSYRNKIPVKTLADKTNLEDLLSFAKNHELCKEEFKDLEVILINSPEDLKKIVFQQRVLLTLITVDIECFNCILYKSL